MATKVIAAITLLKKRYGPVKCALIYNSAWQLLLATMLSAQCTDKTVNKVTAKLFALYPAIEDIDALPRATLEQLIYSTGFYHNKAKNIKAAALHILQEFGGHVPDNMPDLLTIPGVARKTANVVLSVWFAKNDGIVVDTHVRRITNRLGWVSEANPVKIERVLMEIIPQKYWGELSLLLIEHGRQTCTALTPQCSKCPVQNYCKYYQGLKQRSKQNSKANTQNKSQP